MYGVSFNFSNHDIEYILLKASRGDAENLKVTVRVCLSSGHLQFMIACSQVHTWVAGGAMTYNKHAMIRLLFNSRNSGIGNGFSRKVYFYLFFLIYVCFPFNRGTMFRIPLK